MRCPNCESENRQGAKFCDECAAPLPLSCPNCGTENRPGAKFCNECATPLTQQSEVRGSESRVHTSSSPRSYTPKHLAERISAEQAAMAARGALDGERKTITVLFADIKSSMELIEDLDPEEARSIIDPALKLMMAAVHRYEGYVAQSTGDGIFALFGALIACEDHVQRALYAALRMQEDGKRYAEKLRLSKDSNNSFWPKRKATPSSRKALSRCAKARRLGEPRGQSCYGLIISPCRLRRTGRWGFRRKG